MEHVEILGPDGNPYRGYNGTQEGFGGQLAEWNPALQSADAALLPNLDMGNARSDDLVRNHGYASGGVQLHVDNIVGSLFRLSYKPNWQVLGIDEQAAREFAKEVEWEWREFAEDENGLYIDAERKRTFTMLVREATATDTRYGEAMGSAEWIKRPGSFYNTAIKLVSPKRISNPYGAPNTQKLKGGVRCDRFGAALGYYIKSPSHNLDLSLHSYHHGKWQYVRRQTGWGRLQFLHVFEPREDGQTRGDNKFLSIMEQLHMVDKLQKTKLQNAIVNAMYAAVIESELDSEQAMEFILGAEDPAKTNQAINSWMQNIAAYNKGANIRMNGVKTPHLFPGDKLSLKHPSNSDNGFAALEQAILRYCADGMNVSYEQLARDYSNVNYSSARASIMETWRYFMGQRKVKASRFATQVFSLWLEEAISSGKIQLPKGAKYNFWQRKSAWCRCEWIGSGRLSIDGLKEIQEAVLRIESGLSTYEKECAQMGEDYQEIFAQQVREVEERRKAGLPPPSWMQIRAITGNDLSFGPVKDLGIVAGFNYAPEVDSSWVLPGVRFALDLPGFAFAQIDVTAYIHATGGDSSLAGDFSAPFTILDEDTSFMIDFSWAYPFKIGNTSWSIEGHLEYIDGRSQTNNFGTTELESWILFQPQVRLDVGELIGAPSQRLFAGIEYQYWKNKLGAKGVDDNTVQFLAVWRF